MVFALEPVTASLPGQALWLLVIGGIVYTAGVPFHLMERLRFHNAIWHLFVLGGAACQFVAIKGAVIRAALWRLTGLVSRLRITATISEG